MGEKKWWPAIAAAVAGIEYLFLGTGLAAIAIVIGFGIYAFVNDRENR